jgi:ABC-type transport system involved in cytochrome c biogenesis permease subunit
VALAYSVWGIAERCIINERPPVATLYETILFITAVSSLVALLLERVMRNGAGLALTGFLGALGLFLSNRFMALDGQDTMPTLEAVLITNFWLATHVTSINIGYAGAMLASILSMVVLAYRTFARGPGAIEKRRLLTRITYGVVCFGLLFSLVGTVLGGIWANDSWGRFWGWDPKENGALMIVLMGLVILHARLGGYIKETGLHVLSVLLGMITLFSWFGVNQLGVGLHSYGFTDGIWRALLISWGIQGGFMLLGLGHWAFEKWSSGAKAAKAPVKAQG